MTPSFRRWLAVALVLGAASAAAVVFINRTPAVAATLILRNGRIVTLDDGHPDVQAIAARGDRILAIGSEEQIARFKGPDTEVIDLAGQLAVPGLIEGHGHFLGVGQAAMQLNLRNARTWDDVVAMVDTAVRQARPGEWILGRGWHQEKWAVPPSPAVEGFPTHASISAVSPDNPVYLVHASGHAAFANAKAMELAGVTARTANPPGGEILKDTSGEPAGIFRETASGLIARALGEARQKMTPAEIEAEKRRMIALASAEALSKGITTFHDAGVPFADAALYRAVVDEGQLPIRLWVMIREGVDALAAGLAPARLVDHGDHRLTVRAIKVSMDGALGSRGAWLLEPYTDMPASSGLNTTPVEQVRAIAELALANDYQLCVHAIGDRANRETLDIFEQAFASRPGGGRALRWRVEHAQHLHPDDIPRFARLGVVAAMQGIHCTSDALYVLARLGAKRAEAGAYLWQTLVKSGAVVTNGTDAPVEDVDPLASYYATVSRKLADGTRFYPDQRLGRIEALRTYTINAAYSGFEDGIKGTLSPGKLADVTVIDHDILTMPEDDIPAARVAMTIVGGKVAYRR